MAAHELRNPICPILGSIEVIEEKVGNKKEDIRDDMARIIRNAKRLQKVACDILYWLTKLRIVVDLYCSLCI
jgi:nitrogen fixation/metabolism regulation signal transduction histidine kinase